MFRRRDFLLASASLAVFGAAQAARAANAVTRSQIAASQVSLGDYRRLQRVFDKAKRGEPITLGVIGGSISTGSLASRPDNSYVSLVTKWWKDRFPGAEIRRVDAAVAGTGSLFGSLRAQSDLLVHRPDFVIVEFAVNDAWTDEDPYEGLLRHILVSADAPAVMLLFMMYGTGNNEQKWQEKIGLYYGLPMVSFRDAVWPEISAGRLKPSDILVDIVHPNDAGHQMAAQLVIAALEDILEKAGSEPSDGALLLPPPLQSSRFEKADWKDASRLVPRQKNGWVLGKNNNYHPILLGHPVWIAPPSAGPLTFDWSGSGLVAMMMLANDDDGRTTLAIDGKQAPIITKSTQPNRNIAVVAVDLPLGPHSFEISHTGRTDGPIPPNSFGLFGLGMLA
jgi:lysophospholipase L1-like esterase